MDGLEQYRFITLTHANLNTKIEILTKLVFGLYYSENHKATMVTSNGGAIFPAKESVDEVKQMLLNAANNKKETDGNV